MTKPGSPNSSTSRSEHRSHVRRKSSVTEQQAPNDIFAHDTAVDDDQGFGDDFYDFEEGEGTIEEDDFGDFGEAEFPQPMEITNESTAQINGVPMQQPPSPSLVSSLSIKYNPKHAYTASGDSRKLHFLQFSLQLIISPRKKRNCKLIGYHSI